MTGHDAPVDAAAPGWVDGPTEADLPAAIQLAQAARRLRRIDLSSSQQDTLADLVLAIGRSAGWSQLPRAVRAQMWTVLDALDCVGELQRPGQLVRSRRRWWRRLMLGRWGAS
jgi:hypothetical protein